jgi:predicted small lipoprotein YifL
MRILPPTCARVGLAASLLLAGCGGPGPLALPSDPTDRAATCGVVAAASARTGTDVNSPLPLEAQGRILHFTLLAASADGEFVPATAKRVGERMRALEAGVTSGKWQPLAPECQAAYPATARTEVELPSGRLDAQLACEELAQFLAVALEGEAEYANELADYRLLRRELNDALAPGLRARAGGSLERQQSERHRALAAAAQLGSPVAVMAKCADRFGKGAER